MIEPMGVLRLDRSSGGELEIILGDDHDDLVFRFIVFVGGKTGSNLRFDGDGRSKVGDFFQSLEDDEESDEPAILDFLEAEDDAVVLVSFDGEPRIYETYDDEDDED